MYDVLFVGAGPHCLTTLLRLLEPAPDTSIDGPRRKVVPRGTTLALWHRQRSDAGRRAGIAAAQLAQRVAVVDPAGTWLARWRAQFSALGIAHLRSTSAVHPDPLDTYALATFASASSRSDEVRPLTHISKSEEFHGPFHVPGSALFEDFVNDLIKRYNLDDLVTRDAVVQLTPVYGEAGQGSSSCVGAAPARQAIAFWRVGLASGREMEARRVVVGIGSTNTARIPEPLRHLVAVPAAPQCGNGSRSCSGAGSKQQQQQKQCGSDHATSLEELWRHMQAVVAADDRPEYDSCSSCSADRDSTRSSCTDAELMFSLDSSSSSSSSSTEAASEAAAGEQPAAGTYPQGRLMHAWQLVQAAAEAAEPAPAPGVGSRSCTAAARLQALGLLQPGEHVLIVGGGLTSAHLAHLALAAGNNSHATLLMRGDWHTQQFDVPVVNMGPQRARQLQAFARIKSFDQRLLLLKRAGSMPPEVTAELQQLQRAGGLTVHQHSSIVAAEFDWDAGQWEVWLQDGSVLSAHRLWLATGSVVDARAEPLLAQLLAVLPVPIVGGLPAIQPSLEWCDGAGVFMLGAYAALALGPGALNLAGAKTASVVLDRQLRRVLSGLLPGQVVSGSAGSGGSTSSEDVPEKEQQPQQEALALVPCTAGKRGLCVAAAGASARAGRRQHRQGADSECCGACWKTQHLASRSRWGR